MGFKAIGASKNVNILRQAKRLHEIDRGKTFRKFRAEVTNKSFNPPAEGPVAKFAAKTLHYSIGKLAGTALKLAQKGKAERMFIQIMPFIQKNSSVLDVGCGDGRLGEIIMRRKNNWVRLLDIADFNESGLYLERYNGINIPYPKNSFDHVLLIKSLHHFKNPIRVIEEAFRVSRNNVIVVESVHLTEKHRKLNNVLDWVHNKVVKNPKINVPFNTRKADEWLFLFEDLGGNVVRMEHLGIDEPWPPMFHTLYVVEKK